MDNGDSHNGAPFNDTLRDITNTTGSSLAQEQALTSISDESSGKRKRTLNQGQSIYDKGKSEVNHPSKAYKACHYLKGTEFFLINAKPFDSESSKENNELHTEKLVDRLNFSGTFGQISRLNSDADDSSILRIACSNCEDEDILTESDQPKEVFEFDGQSWRNSVHSNQGHKEPGFSDHTVLDCSPPSQRTTDGERILTHEKFQNTSLCGSCPCSLCIKAAFMWSDLIFQDTRGRLTALKSSRRHARILDGKIFRHEKHGKVSQSQLKKAGSTESDLLQHWSSLLRRTEDSFLCEIMQTQSHLVEIEKLKDKFKRDVEAINSEPQNDS